MHPRKTIKNLIEKYRRELGINDKVRYRTRPMKTKAASCNIEKKIIYINKNILDLGEKILSYVVLHELIHIKLKSIDHTNEFYEILHRYFSEEEIRRIYETIVKKLSSINNFAFDL